MKMKFALKLAVAVWIVLLTLAVTLKRDVRVTYKWPDDHVEIPCSKCGETILYARHDGERHIANKIGMDHIEACRGLGWDGEGWIESDG